MMQAADCLDGNQTGVKKKFNSRNFFNPGTVYGVFDLYLCM